MDGSREANLRTSRTRQFSMRMPTPYLPMTFSRQVPVYGRCLDGRIVHRHYLQ